MSYDISFEKVKGETLRFDELHDFKGGVYAQDGTDEAWLNITYNYAGHFRNVFGDDGIRSLYGKTAKEVIPILENAVENLGTQRDGDYWASTEGNAGAALVDLLAIARMCPDDAVMRGD